MIINKYLARLEDLPSRCAFRGQASSQWKLNSAAIRRLTKHYSDWDAGITSIHLQQIYTIYHREILLEPSRTKGFGVEHGNNISDLQLLAKLQHFGAATGLIDFTWDPLISLWFACQQSLGDANNEDDGVLFCIDISDPAKYHRLTNEEESQSVEAIFLTLLNSERQLCWEPVNRGDASPRIFRQQSVFVIENPTYLMEPSCSILVDAQDKTGLLKELRDVFNIDQSTVYADIQGFSRANSQSLPIERIENPTNYLIQGNRFYQQDDYCNAISSYNRCIELDGEASEPYHLRGNAKTKLGDYDGAIKDYGLAIQYKNRPFLHRKKDGIVSSRHIWPLYFNLANVKFAQQDFEGAIQNYDDAIHLCRQSNRNTSDIFLNRGNAKYMSLKLNEAVEDYDRAARQGSLTALFNKGNTLVPMGRFEEAIQSYNEVIVRNPNYPGLQSNLSCAHSVFQKAQMGQYEVSSIEHDDEFGFLFTSIVAVTSASFDRSSVFTFMLLGNIGNTGNIGVHEMPGTTGFPGLPSLVILVYVNVDPPTSIPIIR